MLANRAQASVKCDPCPMSMAKEDVVFSQGDQANYWYEVINGTVRTCRFLVDGHRQLTGFHFNGDVFGMDTGRYQVTAEAITATTLLRYSHPSDDQAGAIGRAYVSAQQFIHLMGHRTAVERLCAFLLMISRKPSASSVLNLPMTRADIGDHLGLTIHTVSRTMTQLARRGVIAIEGRHRVRILDPSALARLGGEADDGHSPNSMPRPPRITAPQAQEISHDA
jgi:CRP/FNR family transcriptional regulator, nitrogen fixation regulation protein